MSGKSPPGNPSEYSWGSRLPLLTASRLELRWLDPADVDAVFQVFGNPNVTRYWSSPALEGPQAAAQLIDEIHQLFADRELFQWGMAFRDSHRVFGTCTLADVDSANRRAEVGFALAEEVWGQGLATEALSRLFRFAFQELGLHRLEADVHPDNVACLAVLEKLGFQREGYLRERWQNQGEIQDSIWLGLLDREWIQAG